MKFPRIFCVLTYLCFIQKDLGGQTGIQGVFKSYPATAYRLVYEQSSLNEYRGISAGEGSTGQKGELSVSLQLPKEGPVLLYLGQQFLRLWMIPSQTLQIKEQDGVYHFSGPAAKQNTFLYQAGILLPFSVKAASPVFDPQARNAYLDSLEKARWQIFKGSFREGDISPAFNAYCTGEIRYFSYFQKSQYPMRYIYLDKSLQREEIYIGYFDFWNGFSLLEDSCSSDFYQNAIRDFIEFRTSAQVNDTSANKERYYTVYFHVLDSILAGHPYTRQKQLTEAIAFLIDYFDQPVLVESCLKKYRELFPATASLGMLEQKWAKKNGNRSVPVDFRLKDLSGNWVSMGSLKGKIVYIDFWGSWCKPCLAQMPFSEKLQEKFRNEKVAFVFIDFYDASDTWKKTVRDRKLPGIHLRAETSDEAYFNQLFGIGSGFPRYALVDKNGLLITSAAPHPNDEHTAGLIEKYLRQ